MEPGPDASGQTSADAALGRHSGAVRRGRIEGHGAPLVLQPIGLAPKARKYEIAKTIEV